MTTPDSIDRYFDAMIAEGLYSTPKKLRFHLETVFGRVPDLKGKSVLDIGGGAGLHSFYAACAGASEVVCLEPEAAGSNSGVQEQFSRMAGVLGIGNVHIYPTVFQEYHRDAPFDVVLLHDSVNHLDEPACMTLLEDEASRDAYREIFAELYGVVSPGGTLIVCDCSRYNVFRSLRIRNPFTPTIEWEKHQSPGVWSGLLREAGFVEVSVVWPAFNRLGGLGRAVLGNPVAAFFLKSYFCLTMRKP